LANSKEVLNVYRNSMPEITQPIISRTKPISKKEQSAIQIQTAIRGKLARKELNQEMFKAQMKPHLNAITKFQVAFREKREEKENKALLERMRPNVESINKIKEAFRNKLARKEVEKRQRTKKARELLKVITPSYNLATKN